MQDRRICHFLASHMCCLVSASANLLVDCVMRSGEVRSGWPRPSAGTAVVLRLLVCLASTKLRWYLQMPTWREGGGGRDMQTLFSHFIDLSIPISLVLSLWPLLLPSPRASRLC